MDPLELLYEALRSPHGIVVPCSSFESARQRLYAARREAGTFDPEAKAQLDKLMLRESPTNPSELWIVKRG